MDISVIGAGPVGLTTAACLAEIGHSVFCFDEDDGKQEQLRNMQVPFFEPHLSRLVKKNVVEGRLRITDAEDAIRRSKVIFICVGTPPLPSGAADISAIESAADKIICSAHGYRLIVEKSTVPVQTAQRLERRLSMRQSKTLEFDVVSNPEFLREGSAVEDFFHPDRIVVGTASKRAIGLMRDTYQPLLEKNFHCPIHRECNSDHDIPFLTMDTNSAELLKHASNSYLAMKISYINMIADLCEATGANIEKVSEGLGLDRRIGSAFLRPGIGFGGFCFPKDLQALIRIGESFDCDFSLLKEVANINRQRVEKVVAKLEKEMSFFRGKVIAVWGVAFKPNTDDVRLAPAVEIIRRLIDRGAQVRAYDPKANPHINGILPEVIVCDNLYEAARGSDAILLLTEWQEFHVVDWARLGGLVSRALIFDGRNALSSEEVSSAGFRYVSIGRAPMEPLISEACAFREVASGSSVG